MLEIQMGEHTNSIASLEVLFESGSLLWYNSIAMLKTSYQQTRSYAFKMDAVPMGICISSYS